MVMCDQSAQNVYISIWSLCQQVLNSCCDLPRDMTDYMLDPKQLWFAFYHDLSV